MKRVIRKIKKYVETYILNIKWVKNMVMPVIMALIISTYLDVQCSQTSSQIANDSEKREGSDKMNSLKLFVLYFCFQYLLKYVVMLFNVHFIAVSMRSGFRNFFSEYLRIRYCDFHKIGVGEAQYNIVRRSGALSEFLASFVMYFMANMFFFLISLHSGITGVDFRTKVVIIMCIMIFIGFNVCIQYVRSKIRMKVNDGFQKNSNKLYDVLLNYEVIVAYGNEKNETEKYYQSMDYQVFYSTIYWVSYEIADALNNLAFIFFNIYMVRQLNMSGTVTKENFQEYTVLFTKLGERMFEMSKNIDDIFTQFTNLDQSMIDGLAIENEEEKLEINRFNNSIKIQDLQFSHADTLALENVNCEIKKGECIAITGPSGSGKSTFMKILLGLYDYNGDVLIDGWNYRDINKRSLRQLISYIPQNACLFDGTVLENLIVGNPGISGEKIIETVHAYNLENTFEGLKYDKMVGERGKNLSGGQAQKISFMRAVIKNGSIFMLDEATSNMDMKSETEIIELLRKNAVGKTIIVIIHNLKVLHMFDRVLYFNNNTLEEQGTFNEIYAANKSFTNFYDKATSQSL